MSNTNHVTIANPSFSQREKLVELPEAMNLGEMSRQLRLDLWYIVSTSFDTQCTSRYGEGILIPDSDWGQVYTKFSMRNLGVPHSDVIYDRADCVRNLEKLFLSGSYNFVLDFMERVIEKPGLLLNPHIERCLLEHNAPYYIVADEDPISGGFRPIFRMAGSKEEGDAIQKAVQDLKSAGMPDAIEHLNKATSHINAGNFLDAITDSIHAVESVAVTITSKPNGTLSDAIAILKQHDFINHPTLLIALEKLYVYTSTGGGNATRKPCCKISKRGNR